MKVLILSCSTGGGHNTAGQAIKAYFESNGVVCDTFDTLSLLPDAIAKVMSSGHVFLYRHFPRLFGVGYRFEEKHKPRYMYRQSAYGADELYSYINENNYDTVICTHVFSALTMTEIRKRHNPRLKIYYVSTDYTCCPGVSRSDMDAYFVPLGLRHEFCAAGIPSKKIFESGIPVNPIFYDNCDKAEARRECGVPENKKLVLLMCGSMGCGPIYELAELMSKKMPRDSQLAAICGSNKKLYNELLKISADNITVVGYTNKMSRWMDAADVILSKPGGLSSTEAMAKKLPLVCINAVPGCETRNLDYLTSRGYAVTGEGVEALSDLACDYLSFPDLRKKIVDKLESDFNVQAVEVIYNCVVELNV